MSTLIHGHATPAGTAAYAKQISTAEGHFREVRGLSLSSIGMGTYLGDPTDAADRDYTAAAAQAFALGCNVFDTAINYRLQRSERAIGAALARMPRETVFVSTKAGFLTPDGAMPASRQEYQEYFEKEYYARGVMDRVEVVGGMHCMAPGYLSDQLERSRKNLNLATIDLFYLHNPETQVPIVGAEEFSRRLRTAFALLESKVQNGVIRWYGAATWNGFRVAPTVRDSISLESMVAAAREAGGEGHHFRFVQLPHNLAMPEALASATQSIKGRTMPMLEAAAELGISVMASGSIMQGRLASGLPDSVLSVSPGLNDAQAALQFTRSTPGVATALVGMGSAAHVSDNLKLASVPPASIDQFRKLFATDEHV